jgi:hypothetical protein
MHSRIGHINALTPLAIDQNALAYYKQRNNS